MLGFTALGCRSDVRIAPLPTPGIVLGAYPERPSVAYSHLSALTRSIDAALKCLPNSQPRRDARFVAAVHTAAASWAALTQGELRAEAKGLRARLSAAGLSEELVAESFALVREVAFRELGLTHYDTQITAARIMLDNQLVEMDTGEGKTLALSLTAATGALAGIPVHVITANDYLAARDTEALRPLYAGLGLTVRAVTSPLDRSARRAAYACDVVYCTAKELVFDYLRDRLVLGRARSDLARRVARLCGEASEPPLLRGLCMALIDEADSVLIDEARMPLVISQSRVDEDQGAACQQALELARSLEAEHDFRLLQAEQGTHLTDSGRKRLSASAAAGAGIWADRRYREELVGLALRALHLVHRDRQYLVRDGRIHIIDETTGRVAAGRVWSRGLHQLIELKEGCELSGAQRTLAQITYQRFFPRYLRLAGISGTLSESSGELAAVYGLGVVHIAPRLPSRRIRRPRLVYTSREAKSQTVVDRAREMLALGRPTLIGTDSVADSELLSLRLDSAGLPHQVLNARHDAAEAKMVAAAGQAGRITVTTNMAGRGTDIKLGAGVAERGGLHVISCQHNSARRIDRQLYGRCARQGAPGSVETILSLEDGLVKRFVPERWITVVSRSVPPGMALPGWLGRVMTGLPQRIEEWRAWSHRWQMRKRDALLDRRLSFGGPRE